MKSIAILKEKTSLILLLLWFLNDAYLKLEYPGFATGKISDLIGVYLSPFIFTCLFGAFTPRIRERVLFQWSSFFVFILFFTINISQEGNLFVYSILTFGSKYQGMADLTDLVCLGMLFPSYVRFYSYRNVTDRKYPALVVILSSFVLFHTSPPPRGRSDALSIALLTFTGYDAIYLETPDNKSTVANISEFKFRYVSKNNESSPPSLSKLEIPKECSTVNEVPKEVNRPKSYSQSSEIPNMFFKDYLLVVAKDASFQSIVAQTNCTQFTCLFDLSQLQAGIYYWKVLVQYVYIEKCERFLYKDQPKQDPLSFTK